MIMKNNELSYQEISEMSERQINAYFRSVDDSHLYPVCGRFNATERAIRRVRELRKRGLEIYDNLEYYKILENTIIEIINNF